MQSKATRFWIHATAGKGISLPQSNLNSNISKELKEHNELLVLQNDNFREALHNIDSLQEELGIL